MGLGNVFFKRLEDRLPKETVEKAEEVEKIIKEQNLAAEVEVPVEATEVVEQPVETKEEVIVETPVEVQPVEAEQIQPVLEAIEPAVEDVVKEEIVESQPVEDKEVLCEAVEEKVEETPAVSVVAETPDYAEYEINPDLAAELKKILEKYAPSIIDEFAEVLKKYL